MTETSFGDNVVLREDGLIVVTVPAGDGVSTLVLSPEEASRIGSDLLFAVRRARG